MSKEIVFLAIIPIIYGLMVLPYYDYISLAFHFFFAIGVFLIVQYFRVVVNERAVFWIRPFYVKLIVGIVNPAFFFLALKRFMYFVDQFEDYNYSGVGMLIRDIYPELSATDYTLLRTSTFFIGVTGLILIVLFEMRLIYSIFKYREVPRFGNR